jgi:hypothetical protein
MRRHSDLDYQDTMIGSIDAGGRIYGLSNGERRLVGYVDQQSRIFRITQYSDREVGSYTQAGRVYSSGLFEGGEIGWLERDGVVVQGGLILGEEEVGVVEGANLHAGAAALLLIFLPDQSEADKQARR